MPMSKQIFSRSSFLLLLGIDEDSEEMKGAEQSLPVEDVSQMREKRVFVSSMQETVSKAPGEVKRKPGMTFGNSTSPTKKPKLGMRNVSLCFSLEF